MEVLLEKLNQIKDKNALKEIYLIISKKEKHIFKLIYDYHECDSWEDIFRDYDKAYLKDKAVGVEMAIQGIVEQINREK